MVAKSRSSCRKDLVEGSVPAVYRPERCYFAAWQAAHSARIGRRADSHDFLESRPVSVGL